MKASIGGKLSRDARGHSGESGPQLFQLAIQFPQRALKHLAMRWVGDGVELRLDVFLGKQKPVAFATAFNLFGRKALVGGGLSFGLGLLLFYRFAFKASSHSGTDVNGNNPASSGPLPIFYLIWTVSTWAPETT